MSAVMVHVPRAYKNNYGHGQRMHQSDLGADGDVLVVPDDFEFGHCSSSLGYPGDYFRLGSLIRYNFKLDSRCKHSVV